MAKRISVAATGTVSLPRSGSVTIAVSVGRFGSFHGAVAVSVLGLPAGVVATPLNIDAGSSSGHIILSSSAAAVLGTKTLTIVATATGVAAAATTSVLNVTTAPVSDPGPVVVPAISLVVTPLVTITQGQTAVMTTTISRTGGFAGAVAVNVSGLPTGVAASGLLIAADATSGTVTLTAGDTAAVGSFTPTVTASAVGVTNKVATLSLVVVALVPDVVSVPPTNLFAARPNLYDGYFYEVQRRAPAVTADVVVHSHAELLDAIVAARASGAPVHTRISYAPGGDYKSAVFVPVSPEDRWLTLQSKVVTDGVVTLQRGRRVTPFQYAQFARVHQLGSSDPTAAFISVIGNSNRVIIRGLEFVADSPLASMNAGILTCAGLLGGGFVPSTDGGLNTPDEVAVAHCRFHATITTYGSYGGGMPRAIYYNSRGMSVTDCDFDEVGSPNNTDQGALNSIDAWGPFTWDNNRAMAGGICFMIGGGGRTNNSRMPEHIVVTRSHFAHTDQMVTNGWKMKSIVELKVQRYALYSGNILGPHITNAENLSGGFTGEVFPMKSVNQDGDRQGIDYDPYHTWDVTAQFNVIMGGVPLMFSPMETYSGGRLQGLQRVDFQRNVCIVMRHPLEEAQLIAGTKNYTQFFGCGGVHIGQPNLTTTFYNVPADLPAWIALRKNTWVRAEHTVVANAIRYERAFGHSGWGQAIVESPFTGMLIEDCILPPAVNGCRDSGGVDVNADGMVQVNLRPNHSVLGASSYNGFPVTTQAQFAATGYGADAAYVTGNSGADATHPFWYDAATQVPQICHEVVLSGEPWATWAPGKTILQSPLDGHTASDGGVIGADVAEVLARVLHCVDGQWTTDEADPAFY